MSSRQTREQSKTRGADDGSATHDSPMRHELTGPEYRAWTWAHCEPPVVRSGENGGAGTESTVRERGRDPLRLLCLERSSNLSPERKCVALAWSLALCDDIGWPRGEIDANLSMVFSTGWCK